MAISRPLLVALVGAVVLFAAVMAVRVVSSRSSSEPGGLATKDRSAPTLSPAPRGSTSARPGGKAAGRHRTTLGGGGVPTEVARALQERKVVVIFFGAQGHDDRATRSAAESVRGRAAVFVDSPYHIEQYARVVGALPITQLPSTIVIDRRHKARVVEGFADAGSLRQLVADAR